MAHGTNKISAPLSPFGTHGKFGRLFTLPPAFDPNDAAVRAALLQLGAPNGPMNGGIGGGIDAKSIPAGMTYLGQFIDHDITFEPTSVLGQKADPEQLHNFRTPALDLDNVYGRGPNDQPYLYVKQTGDNGRYAFAIGQAGGGAVPLTEDLPRLNDTAVIGDPRNDENLFVSKLHLTFLLFHNAVLGIAKQKGFANRAAFDEAHRLVRWHYQWIVSHEFLETMCDPVIVKDVREGAGRKFYTKQQLGFEDAFIPVEFGGAAYRFGHSLVREAYQLVVGGPFKAIFPNPDIPHINVADPIQWRTFFKDDAVANAPMPSNAAHTIDEVLVRALMELPATVVPDQPNSLAARNLLRGVTLGLPTGQDIANKMSLPVLTDAELKVTGGALLGRAPLWYYILREAAVKGGGERLGPVGSTIVAEVLIGLLEEDPFSYKSMNPTWKPELPGAIAGDFRMSDMQKLAGTF